MEMSFGQKKKEVEALAEKLLELARDTITVRFRFFDSAIAKLKTELVYGMGGVYTDSAVMYFDPAFLLREYMSEDGIAVRCYLHMLLHCIFFHRFQYDRLKEAYWNLACDIAVEGIILEMGFPAAGLTRDVRAEAALFRLRKRVPALTAEKIYREFLANPPSDDFMREYTGLFAVDSHDAWRSRPSEEIVLTEQEWRKISRRMQTELKAFSKNKASSELLEKNLVEATREKYDYKALLERFTVTGEELLVNDDEFDYIYYNYGMELYGNMPLVEPLEYKETKKIKEFVIAIDTSASCRGELVKAFVQKTYEILKGTDNFFSRVNIHIVQCDSIVQEDTKIVCEEDFRKFMKEGEIKGFGATDFRPVFHYVEDLREKGEFENLKGLIYFTDGYGIYPERMPEYDVIFAFLNEDETRAPVPGWAIKVVLEQEELSNEYESGKGIY